MKQQLKYDPEDIESLMLAKSFVELLPEERTFVLRHIDSEREYESMRHLLLQSISAMQTEPPEPPNALREKVMDQYRTQFSEKPEHNFWLNLFSTLWTPIRQRPYIALAAASVLVFFGVFLWINPLQNGQLAVEQTVQRSEKIEQKRTDPLTDASSEESMADREMSESEPVLIEKSEQQPAETISTEANESPDQATEEVQSTYGVTEEVEYIGRPQDERTASGAATTAKAPAMMADSEQSESEDTENFSAGTQADTENLVNDALFAVLYTAR